MKDISQSAKLLENYVRSMISHQLEPIPDVLLNIYIVYSHLSDWDKGIELLDLISDSYDNPELKTIAYACKISMLSLKHHYSPTESIYLQKLIDNADEYLSQVPKDSFACLYLLYTIQKLENYRNESTESDVFLKIVETIDSMDPKSLDAKMELLLAECLVNLGYDHYLQEKYVSSEEFYRRAVDLTDRYFDRDDARVRRVIERVALTQCSLIKWLQAEGLLRRLLEYYETLPVENLNTINVECMKAYCQMMNTRGRGNEARNAEALIEKVTNPKPIPPFDIDTFYLSQLE